MANERIPTEKGKEIKNAVTIIVGGQAFTGWEQVTITKNLESIANEFSIQLFDKFEGLQTQWPLRPGVSVKVNIGSERVITGRIEKLDINWAAKSRSFAVSGRSKPGDLVDCTHNGPCEYTNIALDKLAEELVKPFGLRVFVSVTPTIIDKFAVKPGETVFEALDRAARLQGLFFISTRRGNIRLTKTGATEARFRAFSSLEQNVNLLSASSTYDDSKRHNEYRVIGQAAGKDDFFGTDVSQPKGIAKDLGVTRHRPLTMIAESSIDGAKANTRAQWEASSRLAKAIKVSAAVQGWTQGNGTLWGINQIVNFKSTFLGINRDLLIISVQHNDSVNGGEITNLTLTDPQAYTTKPELNKKKSDDIFADLGSNFK